MRSLIAVGSVKGGPGATTLAMALSVCWREWGAIVVEADRAGGDIAAWTGASDEPGLLGLAALARNGSADTLLDDHTRELPSGVRVVTGPAVGVYAASALRMLEDIHFAVLRGSDHAAGTVLVDTGRLTDATHTLLDHVDALIVVASGGVNALSHLVVVIDQLAQRVQRVDLAVVGPSRYTAREIADSFPVTAVHRVPWDPIGAGALCSRRPGRRLRRSALMRSVRRIADSLGPAIVPRPPSEEPPFPLPNVQAVSRDDHAV